MAKLVKKKAKVPNLRFPGFEGEWEDKKLEEICKMQAGKFVSASEINEDLKDGLFPCYGGNGRRGYTKSFNHNGTYSLIGRQGALCGNVTLANGKFYATEHAVVVTPNNSIDTVWMFYLLTHLNLNQYATGMAQPGLSVQNLEKIEATIPKPEKEQQKISSFLSLIDERIVTQNKIITQLQTLMLSLSDQLFTRHVRFKDHGGNDFPDWEEKKLGEVCETNPKTLNLPNSFVYIDLESVVSGSLCTTDKISKNDAPSRAKRLLSQNDILFQMVRPYQKNNFYFDKEGDYVASTGYAQLRTKQNSKFIYYYLHFQKFVDDVIERCTGTSYPAINSTDLSNILINIPIRSEQNFIANCLSSIDKKIEGEKKILQRYESQKKYLLQNMFI